MSKNKDDIDKICTCGCSLDDHGGDDEYPGSTSCRNCDGSNDNNNECLAFEEDHDDDE